MAIDLIQTLPVSTGLTLPPGGALYLGAYVLTYKLGKPPKGASLAMKRMSKGLFGKR
mgnify:CR=1 FL=1